MSIEWITVLMFGSLFLLLLTGLPTAFTTGGLGVLFIWLLWSPEAVNVVVGRIFGLMTQYLLAAIPLFIFMATMLERAGIIQDIYEVAYRWLGGLRGGLAAATVIASTMLAAMTGVIGATEVTMGIIALPEMLKRGYDKQMAIGCILAGGTLGILIPPSILMIVYALVAQQSVGQLYMGSILPGLLLSGLYITYILVRAAIQPSMGPPLPPEERMALREKLALLPRVIVPLLLVALVLGTMFFGIASPTEAAGMGAFGAIMVALLHGRLSLKNLLQASEQTLKATSMVLWTIFGASAFVGFYIANGGAKFVEHTILGTGMGPYGILILMMVILLVLGMFLDWVGIILLAVPIFVPIVKSLGFSPVWYGVLYNVNMQVSFLSPPFGYALYYVKGVAPPEITTLDIWKAAVPFILLQLTGLALCIIFPEIILFLPSLVY
ncbi:MAG: TRAP transporter large permease subunit [SAR324 cluster bacterium]|nr:TRAP transporter large permease subunit [SAR324 cluster bacterium]